MTWRAQFGLRIVATARHWSLWGTWARRIMSAIRDLAGVSAEVVASTDSASFREKMLITHRGLSGPAILQISTFWREASPIRIDLAPGHNASWHSATSAEREAHDLAARLSALQGIFSQALWRRAGWSFTGRQTGHQPLARRNGAPTARLDDRVPPAPKASQRRKSPPAASIRANFPPKRWNPQRARPVFYRRSGGRHRAPGRLQFPVGVGIGRGGGAGDLSAMDL